MPSLLSIHPYTKNFLPGYLGSQHCLTRIPANWTKIFLCNCKVCEIQVSDTRNLWFALILHLIGRSWHSEHSKIILTVHGFISHMLIIALRNNTVCFGVFMPGSLQTEPAWLTRPVWLIGLLRPSNTSNIFVKLFAQQCCAAS